MLLLSACQTLDNGCELECSGCDHVRLRCDIHGEKTQPPLPVPPI